MVADLGTKALTSTRMTFLKSELQMTQTVKISGRKGSLDEQNAAAGEKSDDVLEVSQQSGEAVMALRMITLAAMLHVADAGDVLSREEARDAWTQLGMICLMVLLALGSWVYVRRSGMSASLDLARAEASVEGAEAVVDGEIDAMISVDGSSSVPVPLSGGPIDLENETGISGDSDAVSLDEVPENRYPPCRALVTSRGTRYHVSLLCPSLRRSRHLRWSMWCPSCAKRLRAENLRAPYPEELFCHGPGLVAHLIAECQFCPQGADIYGVCMNCPDGVMREGIENP